MNLHREKMEALAKLNTAEREELLVMMAEEVGDHAEEVRQLSLERAVYGNTADVAEGVLAATEDIERAARRPATPLQIAELRVAMRAELRRLDELGQRMKLVADRVTSSLEATRLRRERESSLSRVAGAILEHEAQVRSDREKFRAGPLGAIMLRREIGEMIRRRLEG